MRLDTHRRSQHVVRNHHKLWLLLIAGMCFGCDGAPQRQKPTHSEEAAYTNCAKSLSKRELSVLSKVTTSVLTGEALPHKNAFPAHLRAKEACEVLVTLLRKNRPVLWRSSRADSFAEAFIKALKHTRERLLTKYSDVEHELLEMQVELSSLENQHAIEPTSQPLESYVGVGLELPKSWYYVLPQERDQMSLKTGEQTITHLIATQINKNTIKSRDMIKRAYRFTQRVLLRASLK